MTLAGCPGAAPRPTDRGAAGSQPGGQWTAVSIPDELFVRAERLAERLGKSRSQVYREALDHYLPSHEPDSVTSSLNELVDELAVETDAWTLEAARQTLGRSDW